MISNLWAAANPSGRVAGEVARRSNPQSERIAAAINSMKKGVQSGGLESAPWYEGLVKIIFDPAGVVMKDPKGGYDQGWVNMLKPPSALG